MRMKTNASLPCLSALLAAALLMSGCAGQQYMGVSLKPGGADPAGVARDLTTAKKP